MPVAGVPIRVAAFPMLVAGVPIRVAGVPTRARSFPIRVAGIPIPFIRKKAPPAVLTQIFFRLLRENAKALFC
jgi:hypothetical protein